MTDIRDGILIETKSLTYRRLLFVEWLLDKLGAKWDSIKIDRKE